MYGSEVHMNCLASFLNLHTVHVVGLRSRLLRNIHALPSIDSIVSSGSSLPDELGNLSGLEDLGGRARPLILTNFRFSLASNDLPDDLSWSRFFSFDFQRRANIVLDRPSFFFAASASQPPPHSCLEAIHGLSALRAVDWSESVDDYLLTAVTDGVRGIVTLSIETLCGGMSSSFIVSR